MTHLQAFQQKLATVADAALISSAQNQRYLSRFPFCDGYLLILPQAAYLLTDFRYEEAAKREADPDFTVLCPDTGLFSAVCSLLKKHGASVLLLEEDHVTLAMRERLAHALAGTELCVGAGTILQELRRYKDERELAAIAEAQALTDAAFSHILNFITPARTEIEVAAELEFFMRKGGAEGPAFDTIAVSGAASALPHGTPADRPLQQGFLTMDFGARVRGYCSDMTRTVVIGRADEQMRHLYDTVLRAQQAALNALHGGIGCRQADAVAREIIDAAGYAGCFGHSLGHGVGLDIHESPRLSSKAPENAVLCVGEVVTVEPGIYLQGKYGCRIEDMVAVNADGSIRNFTKSTKELIELCR